MALVQKWQKDETLRRELDRQRINTELSYLKAQINPHFFFNTLNNIYALTNLDVKKGSGGSFETLPNDALCAI
ncbi:histidine kinase [Algoriphagus boritolerans]|uniref:histidine kinase n=1 Tax=Algoriphagus boritolerans TaxID=308111 RepID=UPI002FCE476D